MFQQWRAMSIYWFSSLMKLRRRLIHQLYLWLQRHISMYFHTSYSFFSRKKLSIQKHVISFTSIFSKKKSLLYLNINLIEIGEDSCLWNVTYTNACVPTHVCTCIQTYVHECKFEYTIRVAKEKSLIKLWVLYWFWLICTCVRDKGE